MPTTSSSTLELRAPTLEELRVFLEQAADDPRPRVSSFVTSPRDRGFADLQRVPLKLREVREEAERGLEAVGVDAEERRRLVVPLQELQERVGNTGSSPEILPPLPWTLAHYMDDGRAIAWTLASRLPAVSRSLVCVSRTPRVLPLIEGMLLERPYRVLALSVNRVRLFEGTARGVRQVEAPDVPTSLEDALGGRIEAHEDHQFHNTARAGGPGSERGSATYHGHGGAPAERVVDLERFHRAVAAAVTDFWRGRDGTPLVLFADASHQGRFRKIRTIPGLVEEAVEGNPERLNPQEVHDSVWPVIRARVEKEAESAGASLERARGQSPLFTDRFDQVVARAVEGRVERMWVAPDAARPGRIDERTGETEKSWPGEDAIDQLSTIVLRKGGAVHVTDQPSTDGVAALLHG